MFGQGLVSTCGNSQLLVGRSAGAGNVVTVSKREQGERGEKRRKKKRKKSKRHAGA